MRSHTNGGDRSGLVTRRGYLGGLALGAVSVTASTGTSAAGGRIPGAPRTDERGPSSCPALGDVDGGHEFATHMHLDGDPAGELCEGDRDGDGRERVVHVTSDGHATTDYASSLVDVSAREPTLGDVADGRLDYDYFEGPESTNAAPDEVFVVVDWREEGADDDVTIAYLTADDGVDPDPADVDCAEDDKAWRTRDVAAELSETGWRDTTVAAGRIESGEMLLPVGIALRDGAVPAEPPLSRYGRDAPLLAVGFGQGFTTREAVVDVYYDDLAVGGGDDAAFYDFPAALPASVDVERRGRGAAQASFELEGDEEGVALGDVDGDSVGLWPYERVTAVPPTREGASARGVRVRDGEGRAVFPAGELDAFEPGRQAVLLAGALDVEGSPVAFVGVAELDASR